MKISALDKIIGLVAAIQLVCGLDFTMVQPLGPQMAATLGAPASYIGYVTGAYAMAAFLAGLAGVGFLDRFDRRQALGVSILGLVAATAMCAVAPNFIALILARCVAGAFAAPVIAMSYAIIADLVPLERRGRAIATASISGSVATVLGLPLGVALAGWAGWRAPFLCIAGGGLVIALIALRALPPMRGTVHGAGPPPLADEANAVRGPLNRAALICAAISAASGFAITSNIAAHLQVNLHYPVARFGQLYMVGGIVVFVVARVSGRLIDRVGSWPVMLLANLIYGATVLELFIDQGAHAPILLLFTGNMLGNSLRNASLQTLLTKIPPAGSRASFLSATGAVQQLGSAVGAVGSGLLLTQVAGPRIEGMDRLGWIVLGLTLSLTPMVLVIEALRRSRRLAGGP